MKMKRMPFNLNLLRIALCMLGLSVISSGFAEDWVYKVRKGDNLWNLTVDHLIDESYVKRVQKLNNIADPWHLLPGTEIRIPSDWIRHYPAIVRVENLHGEAKVLESGKEESKPLLEGGIVMLDDTVMTDADSTLMLRFLDGSRVLLQESSRLKINKLMSMEYTGMSDARLELEAGRLETQVAKDKGTARRFEIKTPATVTSVRGTDYRVSAEVQQKQSRTEVVGGKVNVSGAGKNRLLTKGFGTVTTQGQAPQPPVELLPAPDLNGLPKTFPIVPIQFALAKLEPKQGYRVQIGQTELFRELLFDKTFSSEIIRGPDLPDGAYYLRARGIDDQGLEGFNAQRRIVVNARPESPFQVSPQPGEGLLQESPEFTWSSQQQTLSYHLQLATDQAFTNIVVDKVGLESNEVTIEQKLELGKFYWRVAAVDRDGDGPFSDGQMFRRIPPAPELEAPDISDETLVVRSRAGLPGQRYHFQMAEDDNFSELLVDKETDEPWFEIPRPAGGEYFIRIRTIDPDGFIGPFGAAQSIDVPYSDLYWLLLMLPLFALIAL